MKRAFVTAVLFVIVTLPMIGADVAGQGAPAQPAGQAPEGRGGGRGGAPGGGPFAKVPGQLASGWNASSTVARTKIRHEWADIPVGSNKVHTWIEYPDGDAKAPVVVMSYEAGLDDWIRSVADELATSGLCESARV